MAVKIRSVFTYTGAGDGEGMTRRFSRELKKAMQAGADKHAKRSVASRFTVRGGIERNYAKRSPEYVRRKQREKGTRAPYVYTGRTRDRAKAGMTTKASKKKIIIRVPFNPQVIGWLRKRGYNLRREIGTISFPELNAVAKTVRDKLADNLNNLSGKRKVRV